MTGVLIVVAMAAIAFSLYAGAQYGRTAEAKAVALAMRAEGAAKAEWQSVANRIFSSVNKGFARLKKFL